MRVLLVGSGAREHALGWSLRRSGRVDDLLTLPGNPGLGEISTRIEGVTATEVGAVAAIARVHAVDLVVVGPEAPLAAGLVDAVSRLGIPAFGPTRAAARLESSKAFAKEVMERAEVPTASAWVFEERSEAVSHLRSHPGPYVVKADGLAAGKGVLVTERRDEAIGWIDRCLGGDFGEAGSRVLVEEHLEGPELSVFAVCDGEDALLLEPARDHKRLLDHDEGPNTGGMGAFSPVDVEPGLLARVEEEIIRPTLRTLAADGTPYRGFLYAGLALTAAGPRVIEFNCRLGDPEAQVLLPRLETDLLEILEHATEGRLGKRPALEWSAEAAVDVVLAAPGYPESPKVGDRIRIGEVDEALVFHAGTALDERGRLVTAGGRVLNVVGLAGDRASARAVAYQAVEEISFPGMQFRTDIGEVEQ